jgi:glycosyltransferase involved in cell wall biosynthesis
MRIRSGLDRAAIALADRVSFISRSAATDVLGSDSGARATIVYNGVQTAAPDSNASVAPTELLFVGANTERKRVELLPLILADVGRQRPEARLRIVGFERSENPELVSLARELRVLDKIEFAGRVRSDLLASHYRSARVLIVPSVYEGLPMVILEAMQHGLAVVATRVSGHPEVIEDGVNGLLVPLDDPTAMANAVLRLFDDPSLLARYGTAGRSVVHSQFSVERQVAAYLSEYEGLLRSPAPAS